MSATASNDARDLADTRFLEAGEHGVLNADLWVNGEASTGLWRNARGDLKFSLTPVPPNFGRGPYSGTIWLEREPAKDA